MLAREPEDDEDGATLELTLIAGIIFPRMELRKSLRPLGPPLMPLRRPRMMLMRLLMSTAR